MQSTEISFKYTQSEYVKAERQYLFASKTVTKRSIVVFSLYIPFSFVYLFYSSFNVLGIVSVVVAVLSASLGFLVFFYMPVYKFKQTAKFREAYNITFSDSGIKFKTETIDSDLQWSVYYEIWESSEFYFLIQAPRIYSIIPKRAFKNSDDRQAFEELVLSKLKRNKRAI